MRERIFGESADRSRKRTVLERDCLVQVGVVNACKAESAYSMWGLCPLVILPSTVIACGRLLTPWVFMWALSFAIYFGLKWLTWWDAKSRIYHSSWRSVGYLLAWPGMDADSFLSSDYHVTQPSASSWLGPIAKTISGGMLLWAVARLIPSQDPLLQGWAGMLGLVLLLHFGSFEIIALLWQSFGVTAEPIMRSPVRASSLAEFWGKRWNLGFRDLAHELIFQPTFRTLGTGTASFLVFIVSGIIHDVVISLPARGGYGLPTLYFVLQGAGVSIERSRFGRSLGLCQQGVRGWCFMVVFLAAPAFWLFHPWFVLRVILPFMRAIRAL